MSTHPEKAERVSSPPVGGNTTTPALQVAAPRKMIPRKTSEGRWMGLRGNRLIHAVVATGTIGFLLFGYDQGVMAGIITSRQFYREFPQLASSGFDDVHAATVQGTVVAIYEVGCLFGALFSFLYGEQLGRRRSMLLGCIVMAIGTIIQVTAFRGSKGFLQFCIGRVITGLGNGANTSAIPSWVAECSKSHNRGLLVCIEGSMVAFGTFISYWIDFGLSFVNLSVSWRFPIALQLLFAVLLAAGVLVLPESPRWLFLHGHEEAASQIVADLNDENIEDPDTQRQIRMIVESINATAMMGDVKFRELFQGGKKQHFRRMAVGASSQIFQQLGGCNAVIYYATVLFEQSIRLDTQLSLILGGVLSTVYALSAVASFWLVESLGRRKMFLIGSFGQMVAMIITFACLIPGKPEPSKGAAFGLFFYIIFFGSCWLPLPWLYPAELNPLRTRTKANAVSTAANWLFNFLIVQVTPPMIASIGWGTFLFFAVLNALFIPFIYFFYPETKGRTLEAIDVIFAMGFEEKERPVHIAQRLPEDISDEKVEELTRKLDIHGNGNGDEESSPAVASGPSSQSVSPSATRVHTPTFGDEVAQDKMAKKDVPAQP